MTAREPRRRPTPSGVAGMRRNQWLASVGITGWKKSKSPAALRRNTHRTLKEATVKRFHYDTHDQLRRHLDDFVNAYNFGRRLKTLNGLTPYKAICKVWTNEPKRVTLDPLYQMPGLNI
jgi:hypothetical protein